MSTINFYRQARYDGGTRTGVEVDGETVLERFEPGTAPEDSALLWFVDIRCSGDALPDEAEAVRRWLLERASILRSGVQAVADELRAGIDFTAPISREIPNAGRGIEVQLFCSAIRRIEALRIAEALDEISSRWTEFLNGLAVVEAVAH